MSLESKIMEEMKTAMKAKDEAGLRTLRAIKAAILIEKTSGSGTELTEADEMKMLQKMAKQRRDSLEIFQTQNRADLAIKEEEELAILTRFLPQQMSLDAIKLAVQDVINQTGAKSGADMGKVMGAANKALAGKAEGKMVAEVVKELLK